MGSRLHCLLTDGEPCPPGEPDARRPFPSQACQSSVQTIAHDIPDSYFRRPSDPVRAPSGRLTTSSNPLLGFDVESLKESFVHNLEFALAKDEYSATPLDKYKSLALTVRDRLFERWIQTQQTYYRVERQAGLLPVPGVPDRPHPGQRGRSTWGWTRTSAGPSRSSATSLEDLQQREADAGLGNGGLGRLAACFLDSMATLALPAYGYGIRYEYGIFFQRIRAGPRSRPRTTGCATATPGRSRRPEFLYPVRFYGQVDQWTDGEGRLKVDWTDTQEIMAMAYDTPVPGYRNDTVNNMRLWAAKSTRDFDLDYFNHGDYEKAVSDKAHIGNDLQGPLPQRQRLRGPGAAAEAGVLLCFGHPAGHPPALSQDPSRTASAISRTRWRSS